MDNQLCEMEVHNKGFMLERLGHDCPALQFLREFTQNGIEAIERLHREVVGPHTDGHIEWGTVTTSDGVRKLTVVDNGIGMTGDEMKDYINSLSASSGEQAIEQNFGLGAKISGALHNPHGLLYISKKPGSQSYHVARFMKVGGTYGLQRWGDSESDGWSHYAEVSAQDLSGSDLEALLHPTLRSVPSGTQVVFLGHNDSDDTAAKGAAQWVRKHLNTRYFRFPVNIRIQSEDIGAKRGLRPVRGQQYMLDGVSSAEGFAKGTVQLSNARAHWWVIPKSNHAFDPPLNLDASPKPITSMQTFNPAYQNRGHVGLIYQDEIYNLTTGMAGQRRLQQFGVVMGMDQVVIYIEPSESYANTSRTSLLVEGSDAIPWELWADEFSEKMPEELQAFVDSVDVKVDTRHDDTQIRDRIMEMMDLYATPIYQPSSHGSLELDLSDVGTGGSPDATPGPGASGGTTSGAGGGGGGTKPTGPKPVVRGLKPGGAPGKQLTADDIPRSKVLRGEIAIEHFGGDSYAAFFIDTQNLIQINGESQVVRSLEANYVKMYEGQHSSETVLKVARPILDRWLRTVATEVVVGLRSLRGQQWAKDTVTKTLADSNAFTMALMPRLLLNHAVKRELGQKLPKKKAA